MNTETGLACTNHPRRETAVRCNKCGRPICTSCMVQTPVGMRCRPCAGLRRLPQYQVGPLLLLKSVAAGLPVSAIAWLVVGVVPYLRFFLAIFVGFAVGEAMSRAARRRGNRLLEAAAVGTVIVGWFIADTLYGQMAPGLLTTIGTQPSFAMSLVVPLAIAGFVALVKLR